MCPCAVPVLLSFTAPVITAVADIAYTLPLALNELGT